MKDVEEVIINNIEKNLIFFKEKKMIKDFEIREEKDGKINIIIDPIPIVHKIEIKDTINIKDHIEIIT